MDFNYGTRVADMVVVRFARDGKLVGVWPLGTSKAKITAEIKRMGPIFSRANLRARIEPVTLDAKTGAMIGD